VRSAATNVERTVYGWTVCFTMRRNEHHRGDLVVVDPRDGKKLYSEVAVMRRLGLGEPEAR